MSYLIVLLVYRSGMGTKHEDKTYSSENEWPHVACCIWGDKGTDDSLLWP